ncbi:ATP-binding cassette domain-containing protein [Lysinibacillus sp. NPDC059133]|uniref:ATP-binding cassette domain-containing protein n=1 Tax=Lysinibacillus sp. NPDC059133 TaxID=3346737 RepID=UPI003681AC1A
MRKGRGARLNQGEIVGLMGRNGAGKLMKILTQTIQTDDGSVADNPLGRVLNRGTKTTLIIPQNLFFRNLRKHLQTQ